MKTPRSSGHDMTGLVQSLLEDSPSRGGIRSASLRGLGEQHLVVKFLEKEEQMDNFN